MIQNKWLKHSPLKNLFSDNMRTFLIFCCVGASTAIFYFSVFTFLWKELSINYKLAVSIAYVMGVLFHFSLNRTLTFKSKHALPQQFIKFLGMVLVNYLLTIGIVHYAVEKLHVLPYVGMVLAIAVTTLLSYTMARFWVFSRM